MARKMHERKNVSSGKSKRDFHRSSKPHPMNRAVSFVQGKGIYRGGVQA